MNNTTLHHLSGVEFTYLNQRCEIQEAIAGNITKYDLNLAYRMGRSNQVLWGLEYVVENIHVGFPFIKNGSSNYTNFLSEISVNR